MDRGKKPWEFPRYNHPPVKLAVVLRVHVPRHFEVIICVKKGRSAAAKTAPISRDFVSIQKWSEEQ